MSKSRTVRLVAKVNAEVVVHLHPAVLRVDVDDEHHGALKNYDISKGKVQKKH